MKHQHKLLPDIGRLSHWAVYGYLLLATFLLRFPFFFRDYIDRDESTFILMGQAWVDGYLPYTQLWDVKPPLTFGFFAVLIWLFGKSFIAIRLAGALVVALTAFFTYRIGCHLVPKKWAYYTGMACVGLQSLFGSIQGVMSEHLCMAFFMWGLWVFLTKPKVGWRFLSGLLMGVCLMVKLNMAYPVLILGLYALYSAFRQGSTTKDLRGVLVFGIGIIGVIAATLLPYHQQDLLDLWWRSNITAPLDYATARREPAWSLLPYLLGFTGLLFFGWKKKLLDLRAPKLQVLVLVSLAVLYSFYKAGRVNSHYLIQFYPGLLLILVIMLHSIKWPSRLLFPKWALGLLMLLPMESYVEYGRVVAHTIQTGGPYNGEGFSVPAKIREAGLETRHILFLGYHIGYWVLGEYPPTKAATHPSNLVKEEMFKAYGNPRETALDELRYIMETLRPKTIVVRRGRRIFDKEATAENDYMDKYLQEYYRVRESVEQADILERL